MNHRMLITCAAALAVTTALTGALAVDKVGVGKFEYQSNCAVCHGSDGKGAGAFVDFLKATPPDLTQLTKKNGGVFPLERVLQRHRRPSGREGPRPARHADLGQGLSDQGR